MSRVGSMPVLGRGPMPLVPAPSVVPQSPPVTAAARQRTGAAPAPIKTDLDHAATLQTAFRVSHGSVPPHRLAAPRPVEASIADGPTASAPHVGARPDIEWLETDLPSGHVSGFRESRAVSGEHYNAAANRAAAQGETLTGTPPSQAIDLEHLADQVYRMVERKVRIERERRGL